MKYILLILFILVPIFVFGQEFNYIFEPDSIPYEVEGWNPYCPWAGGNGEAAPDFCDIDADGDLDLFIGEYTGWVEFYKNIGNANSPDFTVQSLIWDSVSCFPNNSRSNPDF